MLRDFLDPPTGFADLPVFSNKLRSPSICNGPIRRSIAGISAPSSLDALATNQATNSTFEVFDLRIAFALLTSFGFRTFAFFGNIFCHPTRKADIIDYAAMLLTVQIEVNVSQLNSSRESLTL